ncbi:MAG: alpha-mannosidase, partial [Lachnospiraceae bacterium]|nr:alpha-mannosidase [Lachnospiraceae bacterium]
PEYRFMSSQAFRYQNLKEEAPELYREVGKRIQEGRWEAEGAMWVEADCNLSSGESLVRQVLYGKRFFREEFGVENRVLWLPDVFGYSAALPQILKKSGVDWFVTSKISWNDTNKLPYDTFLWKGIDGTAVHAYFLTAKKNYGAPSENRTTYNAHTNAPMLSGTYKRYQQKNLTNEVLLTFGYGDGGGGPTVEDLELLRRGTRGVPGAPSASIGFAGDFLKRLEQRIDGNPKLPVWQGELYLEFHRGTYTSQARNKRNNRKAEFLYQKAELLSTLSSALFQTAFPQADLRKGWEILLTNQFHDIIPGSSIHEVYEQCALDYAEAFSIGERITKEAEARIAGAVKKGSYVVLNPTGFRTEGLVKIGGKTVLTPKTAPKGYSIVDSFVSENHIAVSGKTVETDCFRVTFDDCWQITSLYDKDNDREVLKPGAAGNELRLYADYPDTYDAWEWQAYSRDSYRTVTAVSSAEVIEDGVRKGVRIVRPFGQSSITETLWFYDSIRRIDVEAEVDWHERHRMLKAAFPVDVQADKATFEIQFGRIERPTHFNTSWDQARFETCAQKYADLSDNGYGVSLLNDCKYGHDVHDGVIQLSLLRSPTYPDPE